MRRCAEEGSGRSHRGDIDMDDELSNSSAVSPVLAPSSFASGKPLCGIRVPSSPRQVALNESIILPPFQEISRIAGKGQDDRRKQNTLSPYNPPFNYIPDGVSSTADRHERRSDFYISDASETRISPKAQMQSPHFPPLSSRSPSPLAFPHSPPLLSISHFSQVSKGNLSTPTTPGDEPKCRSIPVFDWDNDVPPEQGSVMPHPVVMKTDTELLDACQRPDDDESTASEEVAFCYDPVESDWQQHCIRILLDDGRAQFRCTWLRDDTTSGKCEYQGKRQLVQRHIEMTHLNIRRYICLWPGCNQRYGQKSSFDVHRRTHTGERPFKCKDFECQARFNDPAGLLRHMVQEHQYKPKARKSNYPNGHLPITTNRPRNRRHESP